jgi:hypothetical protein
MGLALLGEDRQKASISLAFRLKKTDNLWRNLFSSLIFVFIFYSPFHDHHAKKE